ncbi:MAG: hypothetical protein AAFV49_16465 [Pseudomonadota bacterium]
MNDSTGAAAETETGARPNSLHPANTRPASLPRGGLRSLVFNLFFYGYTFYIAFRAYLLARFSTRERMLPVLRRWGETVLRAVDIIPDLVPEADVFDEIGAGLEYLRQKLKGNAVAN